MNNLKGFTVIELLIVLMMTSIILATAVPKMNELREVMHKRNSELQIVKHLRWMQAKAVEQGCRGVMKISSDKKRYDMGCDYIPFDQNSEPDFDQKLATHPLPGPVKINSDSTIIFNTRGQSIKSDGELDTRELTLYYYSTPFAVGNIRPTGFFDYVE